MNPLIIAALTLSLTAAVASAGLPGGAKAEKLMKRAYELTGNTKGLYFYIPPRGDLPQQVGDLAKILGLAAKERRPVIIYSPDAQRATREATLAFAMIRPNALKGVSIVCAVGQKNESYIRPVIEATGAKLFVEPLP